MTATPTLTLGERMKAYEHAYRTTLPARTWTLLRVDGKAFHTYTKNMERPFDTRFAADMDTTATALCAQITGTAFAYVQSDEISLLITDLAGENTQPWMGGVKDKIVSLSAAIATATFNQRQALHRVATGHSAATTLALFDSRVWTVDDPAEVVNYFIWRQRDAEKNSVSMAASTHFSHRRLHGLNSTQRRDLLLSEAGVDWNDYPEGFKRGRVIDRVPEQAEVTYTHGRTGQTHTQQVTRHVWSPQPAPEFTHDPDGWITTRIPVRD